MELEEAGDEDLIRDLFSPKSRFEHSLFTCSVRVCRESVGRRLRHAVVEIEPSENIKKENLVTIAQLIRRDPHHTRSNIRRDIFGQPCDNMHLQDEMIDCAVHLLLTINCAKSKYQSNMYEMRGQKPVDWKDNESLVEFMSRIFPRQDTTSVATCNLLRDKRSITARALAKRARIEFRATNSLADHLLHYRGKDRNVVYLFHNTAYLKARLNQLREESLDLDYEHSLNRGTLPPRLLLETLTSLQDILFPVEDLKSEKFLEDLANKKSYALDKDLQERDGYLGRELPECYLYWGERLIHLYQLLKKPEPTTRVTRWLEQHTSERNALYVAIVGLFLSALFGLLSVIVGIVQAVLAYRALPSQSHVL